MWVLSAVSLYLFYHGTKDNSKKQWIFGIELDKTVCVTVSAGWTENGRPPDARSEIAMGDL